MAARRAILVSGPTSLQDRCLDAWQISVSN